MRHRALILVLILVLVGGCAGTLKGLVVTGESLKAIGEEFVAVAAVYKQGCDVDKTIAPAQCKLFHDFGVRFKQSYPLTVSLWEAARKAEDAATEKSARAAILVLGEELSKFGVAAYATIGGK